MKQLMKFSTVGILVLLAMTRLEAAVEGIDVTPAPLVDNSVSVLATDPTALVGASSAAFTFTRSGPTDEAMIVAFTYSGTAVLGADFEETDSSFNPPGPRFVTIPKGLAATDLVIQPKFNAKLRGNKTLAVTLDPVQLSASLATADTKHTRAEVRIVDNIFNDNPPTVSLTSPLNDSILALPVTVLITAEAADPDDQIQKVSFYSNDSFLGAAITSPFTFRWVNPRPGEYALFARAIDQAGKSTLSQPIRVKVTGVAPTVTISSPADKASFPPLSNVPIKVDVTGLGDLSVRLFYDGANVLGDLTKAPYQMTWNNAPAGKHTITARVTDVVGQTATASIQITVADQAPTVKIISPTSGSNFVEGKDIILTAKATASLAAVKEVTFWSNRRILGKGVATAADPTIYRFTWSDAKPNFYLLQATATNTNGTEGTSEAVYISVSDN